MRFSSSKKSSNKKSSSKKSSSKKSSRKRSSNKRSSNKRFSTKHRSSSSQSDQEIKFIQNYFKTTIVFKKPIILNETLHPEVYNVVYDDILNESLNMPLELQGIIHEYKKPNKDVVTLPVLLDYIFPTVGQQIKNGLKNIKIPHKFFDNEKDKHAFDIVIMSIKHARIKNFKLNFKTSSDCDCVWTGSCCEGNYVGLPCNCPDKPCYNDNSKSCKYILINIIVTKR